MVYILWSNTGKLLVLPIQATSVDSLQFIGHTVFANNAGSRGGAVSLDHSTIYLAKNSIVTFRTNTASDVGGAIYVENTVPYNCFYQTHSGSAVMEFMNNSAINGGWNIYGAQLNESKVLITPNEYAEEVLSILTTHIQTQVFLLHLQTQREYVFVKTTNQCVLISATLHKHLKRNFWSRSSLSV